MAQFDLKNRSFYDDLSDEEKRKFSAFLMIRWGSCVVGSQDLEEFYVIATNERLNKYFFNIKTAGHKKLHWLLATTVSPGIGTQKHQWIPPRKKQSNSKHQKKISELFPDLKDDEVELMAQINSEKELQQYLQLHGQE